MRAFEYFEVECSEAKGGESYKKIAADILQDLDLIKVIGRLHIFIDPETPVFLAVGMIRKLPGVVHIHNFANVLEKEGNIILDIGDETYLSQLLSALWDIFGRDNIDQPDRFTIVINSDSLSAKEIEEIVVFDPGKSMYRDLIYAMQWIAPEGFKVRRQHVTERLFYYVASENTLPEDIVDKLVAEKIALVEMQK